MSDFVVFVVVRLWGPRQAALAAMVNQLAKSRFVIRFVQTRGSQRLWLECALPRRPTEQGCAAVRIPTRTPQPKKGDISKKLTMGTFLKSFDKSSALSLTRFRLQR
jgi:hypothetical protein